MKPSNCSIEYIEETLRLVNTSDSALPDRKLDLRIERIFNDSQIHDDHLDRSPESALCYTSSLDACRKLMTKVHPNGLWALSLEEGKYGAAVIDGSFRAGSNLGSPSLEMAILSVVLQRPSLGAAYERRYCKT